ncbi:hypothetical protein CEXT_54761 [Caerostris extrusa]|uniref:Uncharacterized protein n=1 Tax=Caerostris extrusa TaxID=172846 RepID=A0AAV4MSM9_CAEEX|nr:hypothetical protein CEXT_54761 [Caerostris extrusa]
MQILLAKYIYLIESDEVSALTSSEPLLLLGFPNPWKSLAIEESTSLIAFIGVNGHTRSIKQSWLIIHLVVSFVDLINAIASAFCLLWMSPQDRIR